MITNLAQLKEVFEIPDHLIERVLTEAAMEAFKAVFREELKDSESPLVEAIVDAVREMFSDGEVDEISTALATPLSKALMEDIQENGLPDELVTAILEDSEFDLDTIAEQAANKVAARITITDPETTE